jgi:hypothetical protein
MVQMTPEDFARLPVERMAQRLLQNIGADPGLIGRGGTVATVGATRPDALPDHDLARFSPMSLLSDPTFDVRQYLEDLVSIAVTSAQQAEGVALKAQEASRKARRAMAFVATLGTIGLLVGVAGFAAERTAVTRLAQVSSEVRQLQDMQRTAEGELAVIAAVTAERHATATTTQAAAPAHAAPNPSSPAPTVWRTPIPHSDPWPASPSPARRISTTHNQAVLPPFLRTLFH